MNALTPVLHGEIVEGSIPAAYRASVMEGAWDRREMPAGLSVQEIAEAFSAPRTARAYVGGQLVERRYWRGLRPKAGVPVSLIVVPHDGDGLLRTIALVAVSVAALVAAPLLGPMLAVGLGFGSATAATIAGSIVGATITAIGTFAINALFPVAQPDAPRLASPSQTYSIGGARNEARRFQPIPVVLGRHRISPPYAAAPYTETVGGQQYLRLLFAVGYGPLSIANLRIGETGIGRFDDVEWEFLEGRPGDGKPEHYARIASQEDLSLALVHDNWQVRETAADAEWISVDISAPRGVYRLNGVGTPKPYEARLRLEYRLKGSGTWLLWREVALSSDETEPVLKGWSKRVDQGKYEVRVKRLTVDDDALDDGSTYVSETWWATLRTFRRGDVFASPQPTALLSMRIRARDQLSGVIDTLNGTAQSIGWGMQGGEWVAEMETSNPAGLFRTVAQGPANARPLADAEIDLDGIAEWWDDCEAKGWEFEAVIDYQTSVFETLKAIAAAGRAALTFDAGSGKLGVIIDDPNAPVTQVFTPANIGGFKSTRTYRDMPDGLRVQFLNRFKQYRQDERIVPRDGLSADDVSLVEAVELRGVTHPRQVWRHAKYQLRQMEDRPEIYELSGIDAEHLFCTRGDRIRVSHDVVRFGLAAGRVKAVAGGVVTLDNAVEMQAGTAYAIRFRDGSTGGSWTRTVTTAAGEQTQVTLTGAGADPQEGDLFSFGVAGQDSEILRVHSIERGPDLTATIYAVDDGPETATNDSLADPAFQSFLGAYDDPLDYAPSSLRAEPGRVVTTAGGRVDVTLTWQAPQGVVAERHEIQTSRTADQDWIAVGYAGENETQRVVRDVAPGVRHYRVRTLIRHPRTLERLGWSGWTTVRTTVADADAPPPNVTELWSEIVGDTLILSWPRVDTAAGIIRGYRVRWSPALTGVTAASASEVVSLVDGTQASLPARPGTYLLTAVSWSGVESAAPVALVTTQGPNIRARTEAVIAEAPDWGGSMTGVYAGGDDKLRLDYAGDLFARADFFGVADFFLGDSGIVQAGVYEFEDAIDLGAVYTIRLAATLDATGEKVSDDVFAREDFFEVEDMFGVTAADWLARIEVRTSDDGAAWGAWEPVTAGEYTARAFEFRLILESRSFNVTPVIDAAGVTALIPERIEAAGDVTVPVGGLSVTFDSAFRSLGAVTYAVQNAATGDYATVSAKSASGFSIQIRDSGGSAVSRIIDWQAIGYGRAA